jgi:TatD DNase family protein
MTFSDTHCHIHEESYAEAEAAYDRAMEQGVTTVICVGTDIKSSQEAVEFALAHENAWATLGVHPHEAKRDGARLDEFRKLLEHPKNRAKIVGIGEIGLDYYYNHSPREVQIDVLRAQIELAIEFSLPVSFHVRDAFDDFWPIFDSFEGLRGVLHSFTDSQSNLDAALARGLFIGVNGISTFAKDRTGIYKAIPLEKLLLETDAPFLTPVPKRGTVNEPAFITLVANFLSDLHSVSLEELSAATQRNATTLFSQTNI